MYLTQYLIILIYIFGSPFEFGDRTIQRDGEIDGDVNHLIQASWIKWRAATAVLCDRKFQSRLKGKFYRADIRPAMLYGTECWPVKKSFEHKWKLQKCVC